ncbi:ankyrin repeat-containing domain protein, partial [Mycena leptocephala]
PNLNRESYAGALQSASGRGYIQIVQLLLEKGTNPNWREAGCPGALQSASSVGNTENIQLSLGMGADLDVFHKEDAGALQLASWRGCPEIVRLLLDKGADPNAHGPSVDQEYHASPLRIASWLGHTDVVRILLEKGADISLLTFWLPSCDVFTYCRVVDGFCQRRMGCRNVELPWARRIFNFDQPPKHGNSAPSPVLCILGPMFLMDPNVLDEKRGSPIQAAAQWGEYDIVKLLRESGAVDVVTKSAATALE